MHDSALTMPTTGSVTTPVAPSTIQSASTTSEAAQDVLIVGGGMVGLTLALMLAKQGIAATLLEAQAYPAQLAEPAYLSSFDGRNTALSRRTVQIYSELGLRDALQPYMTSILQVLISEEGGFGRATLDAAQEQVESFGQVIENRALGQVLLAAARQSPLITLLDGAQVTGISQQPDQVTVGFQQTTIGQRAADGQPPVTQTRQAALLVAADGRDSPCRHWLGIGAQVRDYQQVAVVAVVETDQPHQQRAFERFSVNGPQALLPLPGAFRRSVVWIVRAGEEGRLLTDDGHFLQTLQHSYGDRAGRFLRTGARSHYPLSQVLADRQVSRRVVLLGNAAHTLHPVAGQGFNLCVRDADSLCAMLQQQRLRQVDLGEPAMLLRYEKTRLTDQKRVIRFCDSVVRGFSHPNPVLKLARNAGLLAFDLIPGIKQLTANYAMGLKT